MSLNVFELFAKIGLDTKEYDKGLNDSKSKLSGLGNSIKSGLATAAKVGLAATTAAVGAATTALVGLSKAAVSNYAQYEQLVGGVDKLYGTASEKIQSYADQAYQTSGMSANKYMETATSFSAALINSLSGDVDKAADLTDVAMRAMSDNVNVFGSDIQSVQNAFQGFAKQNYTMLDNLKLGYGGTKSEMERLIADANEYRASIGQSADLSIDSFADIVQAIQSVQEAQHIAGTTSKEAMTTIEGSANATKAAWENVITAIGRGEGISEAFSGLVNSIFGEKEGEGLLNQIIPRIHQVFEGIATFVEQAGPLFADKIPALVDAILPTILESGVTLIKTLADGLISALPLIFDTGFQIIMSLLDAITELLPKVGEMAMQTLGQFATSLAEAAPEIIPDAVNAIIDTILALLENVDALVEGAVALVTGLTDGIMNALPILIERLPEIIVKIIEALILAAPQLALVGPQLILSLISGIIQSIPTLLTMGPRLVGELVTALIQDAPKMIKGGIKQVKKLIEGIVQMIPDLLTLPADIVTQMVTVFVEQGGQLFQTGADLVAKIGEGFSSVIDEAFQWGADLIDNFISGILDNVDALMDTVSDIADSISSMIGFSEPEKGPLSDFHTYAPDMMKLFAKGIKDNEKLVTDQISDSFNFESMIKDQDIGINANVQSTGIGSVSQDNHSDAKRIISLLEELVNNGIHNDIELKGDAEDIFSVVRRKNYEFTQATGYSGI
jgi:phage-related protein/predicted transcriptional regulator